VPLLVSDGMLDYGEDAGILISFVSHTISTVILERKSLRDTWSFFRLGVLPVAQQFDETRGPDVAQ